MKRTGFFFCTQLIDCDLQITEESIINWLLGYSFCTSVAPASSTHFVLCGRNDWKRSLNFFSHRPRIFEFACYLLFIYLSIYLFTYKFWDVSCPWTHNLASRLGLQVHPASYDFKLSYLIHACNPVQKICLYIVLLFFSFCVKKLQYFLL